MPDMLAYRAEELAAGWPEKKVLNKFAASKVLILDKHLIDKPADEQMHFLLELAERRYTAARPSYNRSTLWTLGTGGWAAALTPRAL